MEHLHAVLLSNEGSPSGILINYTDQHRIRQRGIQPRMVLTEMPDPDYTGTKCGYSHLGLTESISREIDLLNVGHPEINGSFDSHILRRLKSP